MTQEMIQAAVPTFGFVLLIGAFRVWMAIDSRRPIRSIYGPLPATKR